YQRHGYGLRPFHGAKQRRGIRQGFEREQASQLATRHALAGRAIFHTYQRNLGGYLARRFLLAGRFLRAGVQRQALRSTSRLQQRQHDVDLHQRRRLAGDGLREERLRYHGDHRRIPEHRRHRPVDQRVRHRSATVRSQAHEELVIAPTQKQRAAKQRRPSLQTPEADNRIIYQYLRYFIENNPE